MSSTIQKEALFNEVKGSLFEFLVGRNLARHHGTEKEFLQNIDRNYLNVLSQQDNMVRQFYPEMGSFLLTMSEKTVKEMSRVMGEVPREPRLMGKLVNSTPKQEWHEADLIFSVQGQDRPVSLKLNKKGAFVNTKSAGIKSFFSHYFPFLAPSIQEAFNQLVDLEFERMSRDLHAHADLAYPGDFSRWIAKGYSELPGELAEEQRQILKLYYSRLASQMHIILTEASRLNTGAFKKSLQPLLGFSSEDIIQVICFHDFKNNNEASEIYLHDFRELSEQMKDVSLRPFGQVASVEIELGDWVLQIRIKPMNKFTTTAIKINCSVRVRRSSEA